MKRVYLLVLLYTVVSVVTCNDGEHDSYETSDSSEFFQEPINFEDSPVDYVTCIEDGTCIPTGIPEETESSYLTGEPENSLPEENGYLEDAQSGHHISKSHYTKLCNKLGLKMQVLETQHPELKELKFQLLKMLDAPGASFNLECKTGESIITKILDLAIFLAEKLKADFTEVHKKIPVEVSTSIPTEEIIAEEHDVPVQVGSVRGIPGKHYPNYSEVPITSFSCSDKKYIPGFYADLETGCQVFHVCYEHRRESFLCPVGTIFNQPILACDYWYSANCSQAPLYFDVKETENIDVSKDVSNIGNLITTIIEGDESKYVEKPDIVIPKGDLNDLLKFLPIKAKIVEFEKPRVIPSKPMVIPKPIVLPILKPLPLLKPKLTAKVAVAKAKFAAAAVPIVKAKVISAATLPVLKAKVAAAAVPIVKAKVVSAAALPVLKAKVAVPVVKAKFAAAAVPIVKAKVVSAAALPVLKAKAVIPVAKAKFAAAAAVPIVKAKFFSAAAVPVFKAKVAVPVIKSKVMPVVKSKFVALPLMKTKYAASAKVPVFKAKTVAKVIPFVKLTAKKSKFVAGVPIIKAKFAKSAMISPLTKKALALGYMKMLKAKKLVLMG